jgi:hypothetical protein
LREKVAAQGEKGRLGEACGFAYLVEDRVGTDGDLVVLEAQDAEASRSEPGVASGVGFLECVQRAVGFHHEPAPEADEIRHVRSKRDLSAELQAIESAVAQEIPESALVEDRFVAHAFGVASRGFRVAHDENNT